jgi:hypothetical protein
MGRLLDTPIVELELLPTAYRLICLTRPSPNTDLLIYPISLLASIILY